MAVTLILGANLSLVASFCGLVARVSHYFLFMVSELSGDFEFFLVPNVPVPFVNLGLRCA